MRTWFFVSFIVALGSVRLAAAAGNDDRVDRLDEKYRVWLEEEVNYIIADVEREAFLSLETETEFQAFIQAFWRKRDENPTTLENETLLEHYERLEYVNKFFGRATSRKGWMTDRGRYHIILGPPAERQNYEGFDSIYPSELWFYNDPKYKQYGLPPFFYLLFFRRGGFGELELYNPVSDQPSDLLTGYQAKANFFAADIERAYTEIYENVSPELAGATLSFRTDEADTSQFTAPAFGTLALLDYINKAPTRRVDTSYAENFDAERGTVESGYLFSYVPSWGMVNVLPGPGEAHYVHWVIEVDPQNIALVKDEERGLYATLFILSTEVVPRDDPGLVLVDARKESFMNFRERQIENALTRPFSYRGMFPIAPGSYDVRILWRNRACATNDESSCRKSYTVLEATVDVPEPGATRPRLSHTVLGYGTERDEEKPAYRAYRFGTLEFLPNARRVYAIGDRVTVMTEALDAPEGSHVRFRIVSRDTTDTTELLERQVSATGFRLEPLVQELSLEGMAGGRYGLVVDLVDADGKVLDSRREPFEITPRTAVVRPGVRGSWTAVSPEIPGLLQMALGQQYLNLEQRERARELLQASVDANPRMPPAREALAALLLEEDEVDEALELIAPIRQFMPDRYEMLVLLGEARFKQQNYAEAKEALAKAATARRLEPRLIRMRALSHAELGELEQALALVERSLSANPDQSDLQALLTELQSRGQ